MEQGDTPEAEAIRIVRALRRRLTDYDREIRMADYNDERRSVRIRFVEDVRKLLQETTDGTW